MKDGKKGSDVRDVRQDMIEESMSIIDEARRSGVVLRLIGGLAIRRYCAVIEFCDRDYSDIDMVGLSKQSREIIHVFNQLGYMENIKVATATGGRQLQFYKECTHMDAGAHYFIHPDDHVDVFLNTFKMDHDIDLKKRLTIEDYTISVSDLILSKLQINKINEKDIRDTLTVLKDIPIGDTDTRNTVNIAYIAEVCSRDWGLYQDITENINKCLSLLNRYELKDTEKVELKMNLQKLKKTIEDYPKSIKWKTRALFGKKLPWYREVEDPQLESSAQQYQIQKQ